MLVEALRWIQERVEKGSRIQVHAHGDQTFVDRELHRLAAKIPTPKAVGHTTLRSLCQYVQDNPDTIEPESFLQVVSPTEVRLFTPKLGELEERKCWAYAQAEVPTQRFGVYIPLEDFCIYVRTCFIQHDERDAMVAFLGNVVQDAQVETADDGVTQKTSVRKGISFRSEPTAVPGLVTLAPYRTFHDVVQPVSHFVLRLKEGPQGVHAALFEADGGAWRHEATELVADYLRSNQELQVYA